MSDSASSSHAISAEGHITVNGVAHYCRAIGHGDPVVVLHGGPGMWHDELFPFFDDLAGDHQVVFYDQRGNGKSLMPDITFENFTVDWLVSDLEELRTAWGFDRMTVIGHSWGGLLGMYYATRHPDRLDRLVLIDPAPTTTNLLMQSYRVLVDRLSPDGWKRLEQMYESDAYLAGEPASHNDAMRLSEGVTFHIAAAREQYFDMIAFDGVTARNMVAISGPAQRIKMNVVIEDDLGSISCPTLIVYGAEDFIVPTARERIHRLIPNSQLAIIPDSGHYPFMEQPETFASTLRTFIDATG